MKTAFWVALTLCALALSGCTEEVPPLTEDDCKVLGMILDPAVEQVDNETGETFIGPGCIEDVPSVTVELEGAPETVQAWTPVSLTWRLHTTLEEDHSHNNGIRASTTSDPSYQGKVDGYGDAIPGAKLEHRGFVDGDFTTVAWTPEDPGTYYVRAYAVSAWGNFWAPEHKVVVTEVVPTGEGQTVTLSGGGLPGAGTVSPDTVDIGLGDSVTWTSSDPGVTWTIHRSNGPQKATPFAVGTDEALVFTVPGHYTYKAYTEEFGSDQFVQGTINVAFPK